MEPEFIVQVTGWTLVSYMTLRGGLALALWAKAFLNKK